MNPYHRGASQARILNATVALLGAMAMPYSTREDRRICDALDIEPDHPSEPSPEDLRRIEAARFKRDRKAARKLKQST